MIYQMADLITELQQMIDENQLGSLQILWEEWSDPRSGVVISDLYQMIYLYAAYQRKWDICHWLDVVFEGLDEDLQRAIFPMFDYA